jgi:hypothetical protein
MGGAAKRPRGLRPQCLGGQRMQRVVGGSLEQQPYRRFISDITEMDRCVVEVHVRHGMLVKVTCGNGWAVFNSAAGKPLPRESV